MNQRRRRTPKNSFLYVLTFLVLLQYQNCAQPINQSVNGSDPAFVASPMLGGGLDGAVSANNGSGHMLFAASSLELSSNSDYLRPGGVCSLASGSGQVHWQLAEDKVNSMILSQGSENCEHGSFYVNLNAQISSLECDKAYLLIANHPGEGSAQISILKHCSGVASN